MRILFSRNFACAKFCENINLAKISEITVMGVMLPITTVVERCKAAARLMYIEFVLNL